MRQSQRVIRVVAAAPEALAPVPPARALRQRWRERVGPPAGPRARAQVAPRRGGRLMPRGVKGKLGVPRTGADGRRSQVARRPLVKRRFLVLILASGGPSVVVRSLRCGIARRREGFCGICALSRLARRLRCRGGRVRRGRRSRSWGRRQRLVVSGPESRDRRESRRSRRGRLRVSRGRRARRLGRGHARVEPARHGTRLRWGAERGGTHHWP